MTLNLSNLLSVCVMYLEAFLSNFSHYQKANNYSDRQSFLEKQHIIYIVNVIHLESFANIKVIVLSKILKQYCISEIDDCYCS